MPAPEPPRLNQHGQEIWFKAAEYESGYWPVHRKGWKVVILTIVWIHVSAAVGVGMILLWAFDRVPLFIAFIVPLVILVPGLLRLARTVRRHS